MRKTGIFSLIFAGTLTLFSCNQSGTNSNGGNADSTQTANTDNSSSSKKYGIKSAIVTQEADAMGMKMNPVLYFDDYGNKECIETKSEIEMMGQKIKTHTLNISKDGYNYEIDLEKKTGKKIKMPSSLNAAGIDFKNLSEEIMKEMSIKKEGKETFLGKECDKFSIDNEKMKMKGEYLVYENVLLKMKADIMGIPTSVIATKFEENASIPADKFEIPADITITEYNMSGQPVEEKK